MKKSKTNIPNFLVLMAFAVGIYFLFQITSVFEDYSVISMVNVEVVEMIDNGAELEDVRQYVNDEIHRWGYRGTITVGGSDLSMMNEDTFNQVKNGKVEVEIKYKLKLPLNLASTGDLIMKSKR